MFSEIDLSFQVTRLGLVLIKGFLEMLFLHLQTSPLHFTFTECHQSKALTRATAFFWAKWLPLLQCEGSLGEDTMKVARSLSHHRVAYLLQVLFP